MSKHGINQTTKHPISQNLGWRGSRRDYNITTNITNNINCNIISRMTSNVLVILLVCTPGVTRGSMVWVSNWASCCVRVSCYIVVSV